MKGSRSNWREHGKPHTERPGLDPNPQPSYCEVTVLTTPCNTSDQLTQQILEYNILLFNPSKLTPCCSKVLYLIKMKVRWLDEVYLKESRMQSHFCVNSRCAFKHDWMLTNTNRVCQCDGPPGSTGQCFIEELWEPVKWGAFNVINTRLIWPQCLKETPAGVRFELIEKSQQHVCRLTVTWRKHPLANSLFHYAHP